jgi:hypothetical protein
MIEILREWFQERGYRPTNTPAHLPSESFDVHTPTADGKVLSSTKAAGGTVTHTLYYRCQNIKLVEWDRFIPHTVFNINIADPDLFPELEKIFPPL